MITSGKFYYKQIKQGTEVKTMGGSRNEKEVRGSILDGVVGEGVLV